MLGIMLGLALRTSELQMTSGFDAVISWLVVISNYSQHRPMNRQLRACKLNFRSGV